MMRCALDVLLRVHGDFRLRRVDVTAPCGYDVLRAHDILRLRRVYDVLRRVHDVLRCVYDVLGRVAVCH